jgi:hypothetical protein
MAEDKTLVDFETAITEVLSTWEMPEINALCDKFSVARSTLLRWAIGVATPHPQVQKLITEEINIMLANKK